EAEVEAVMSRTDPAEVGLCLDTGHLTFGGGDPVRVLERYAARVWHVHFKDCSPAVADRARAEGWTYLRAVREGVFCELGAGGVGFRRGLGARLAGSYGGWIVVEQDVLPGMGEPALSAARNRAYLRQLEI